MAPKPTPAQMAEAIARIDYLASPGKDEQKLRVKLLSAVSRAAPAAKELQARMVASRAAVTEVLKAIDAEWAGDGDFEEIRRHKTRGLAAWSEYVVDRDLWLYALNGGPVTA